MRLVTETDAYEQLNAIQARNTRTQERTNDVAPLLQDVTFRDFLVDMTGIWVHSGNKLVHRKTDASMKHARSWREFVRTQYESPIRVEQLNARGKIQVFNDLPAKILQELFRQIGERWSKLSKNLPSQGDGDKHGQIRKRTAKSCDRSVVDDDSVGQDSGSGSGTGSEGKRRRVIINVDDTDDDETHSNYNDGTEHSSCD